ncbi:MAG: hypothetical protein ACJAV7_000673, partial [Flavobacteriales bacterium]
MLYCQAILQVDISFFILLTGWIIEKSWVCELKFMEK